MITLARLPDWTTLLSRFVEGRREMPFAWGPNDCCSFSIFAVECFTGTLVMPVTWDSEETAFAAIEAADGIEAKCVDMFGPPIRNFRSMRRGDVGLCFHNNLRSVMICTGSQVCGPAIDRLGFFPLHRVEMHWKIG